MDATYRQIWVKASWSEQCPLSVASSRALPSQCLSRYSVEGSDMERGPFRYCYSTHYFMPGNTLGVEEEFAF